MKELINRIAAQFADFNTDANLQAEKGNKAAGLRARKAAIALIADLKEFRKQSQTAAKE